MACKKPYITAPCSKDLIYKNDVGITLKRNFNQKEIIDSLNMLIEDEALRRKLGNNGFQKINKKFKWDILMKKFNNEIIQTLSNN